MIKTKTVTSIFGLPVYTDDGEYFGEVEEAIIAGNRVYGWRIRSTKHSKLSKILGGAKGVIVPHSLVKSIGTIVLISRAAVPSEEEEETVAA